MSRDTIKGQIEELKQLKKAVNAFNDESYIKIKKNYICILDEMIKDANRELDSISGTKDGDPLKNPRLNELSSALTAGINAFKTSDNTHLDAYLKGVRDRRCTAGAGSEHLMSKGIQALYITLTVLAVVIAALVVTILSIISASALLPISLLICTFVGFYAVKSLHLPDKLAGYDNTQSIISSNAGLFKRTLTETPQELKNYLAAPPAAPGGR